VPLADPVALSSLACLYHHVSPLFQALQVSLVVPLILAGPVDKRITVLVGVYKNTVTIIQYGFSNVQKYSQHVKICSEMLFLVKMCLFRNTGLGEVMCSLCFQTDVQYYDPMHSSVQTVLTVSSAEHSTTDCGI
jgi:hypothetical protein